jgi:hypothetical protein
VSREKVPDRKVTKVVHDLKNALTTLRVFVDMSEKGFDFKSADGVDMVEEAKAAIAKLDNHLMVAPDSNLKSKNTVTS